MDSNGPGQINAMKDVPGTHFKYAEGQMLCPYLRVRVSTLLISDKINVMQLVALLTQ